MKITTIGIDLAKNVFQVHGVDAQGKTVLKKQLKRDQVASFFIQLELAAADPWSAKRAAQTAAGLPPRK